jgi:hypothetical protein
LLFEGGLDYSPNLGILNHFNSLFSVLKGINSENGLVVGLSILSLNQFAENVVKAEALSTVIASIHKGLQDDETLPNTAHRSTRRGADSCRNVEIAQL